MKIRGRKVKRVVYGRMVNATTKRNTYVVSVPGMNGAVTKVKSAMKKENLLYAQWRNLKKISGTTMKIWNREIYLILIIK